MINWYEKVDFDKEVFYVDYDKMEVVSGVLLDLLIEYAEETTTPHGVGKKYHTRGKELWSYGFAGNNPKKIRDFDSEEEADHALMLSFKYDLDNDQDAPLYYDNKKDAEEELEDSREDNE